MKTAIQERFQRPRAFFPVIHCINEEQVYKQASIACRGGADGVFLINQGGMNAQDVAICGFKTGLVMGPFEKPALGSRIGVNLLGYSLSDVVRRSTDWADPQYGSHNVWIDHAGFMTRQEDNLVAAYRIRSARQQDRRWGGLLFGGVAFKYQEPIGLDDVGFVAQMAALGGVDVVTTSGPATGAPPTIAKIERMKGALTTSEGSHALAIASGMTCENIGDFLPYADAFLVSTGIEEQFGAFDPVRLARMAGIIHSYEPSPTAPE